MTDAYRDALGYLYGRLNYERAGLPPQGSGELRVGRMRRFLKRLGDPQEALRIVHVAGTKGKGSTAAMIAASLTAAGHSTALFTSPHLHRLEERYVINGQPIAPEVLVRLVDQVRPVAEAMDRDDPRPVDRPLTFFEITTAMGLLHFAQSNVKAVVLEVGMGGRLDSTNAVRPTVGVITSISFDHVRQLGPTLAHIATEKAGILKRRMPAICGVLAAEPREAIHRVAARRGTELKQLGLDFEYEATDPIPPLDRPTTGTVRVQTWKRRWQPVAVPLFGGHQAHNAALAMATLDLLEEQEPDLAVKDADLAAGFAGLRWPARVELLAEEPWIVVDGSHNVASAASLAETLRRQFPDVPRTLIFGSSRDKDMAGQLEVLLPLFSQVIATRYVENPRAFAPVEVAEAVERQGGPAAWIAAEPALAMETALRITPGQGLICVAGSLFLAAETRALLLGLEPSPTPTAAVLKP